MTIADTTIDAERLVKPAMARGWRRRCPHCGSGPMMRGYLAVRDSCAVCNEELHHHRADDGPAYLTILIVGHVLAVGMHFYFTTFRPEPLQFAAPDQRRHDRLSMGAPSARLWQGRRVNHDAGPHRSPRMVQT